MSSTLKALTSTFQFHKGTIKTLQLYRKMQTEYANFNSIKVRLKPNGGTDQLAVTKFQFHKGTIKTYWANPNETFKIFQFHKGTIKTCRCFKAGRYLQISIP